MPLDKAAEVEPVIIVNAPARQQTLAVGAGDALGRAMFDHYVALVRAQRQDRLLREQRVAGVSDSH